MSQATKCEVERCGETARPGQPMCGVHLAMLPVEMERAIWRAQRKGDFRAYRLARSEAVAFVQRLEQQQRLPL